MEFSLQFSGSNSSRTYDLQYIPGPVWMKDEKEVLNLKLAYYELGGVEKLLKKEEAYFNNKQIWYGVEIIIHEYGHGKAECLALLIQDLVNNDFMPKIQFGQSGN